VAPLRGIGACVFDAYGTLLDVASAAHRCRHELGDKLDPLNAIWRDKQLQYTWLRSLQDRHADFLQVTGDALDFALDALGIAEPGLRERLLDLYRTLDAYPEVPATLARLRKAGLKTAILSNGTPDMLEAASKAAGIDRLLDHILSVEAVGTYKPHPSVYRLAVERLALPADSIAFVSSNGWDAYGASAFGMRVIWCNRRGQCAERLPGRPDAVVGSLDAIPDLLGA
jgi:2-haloacid dehalogenase